MRAADVTDSPRQRGVAEAALTVQYAAPRLGLPARRSIARWVDAALERPATLTVRFVGRVEGRALNRLYRGKDYATNVLTFTYADAPLAGDIVLCAPVVAAEARRDRKPLAAHYAHLVVHGTLHLQGYDHERARDAAAMERHETALLAALGYADPYRPITDERRAA
jgi:probable rRNA maturation factor